MNPILTNPPFGRWFFKRDRRNASARSTGFFAVTR